MVIYDIIKCNVKHFKRFGYRLSNAFSGTQMLRSFLSLFTRRKRILPRNEERKAFVEVAPPIDQSTPGWMTGRGQQIQESMELISEERLINFFRFVRGARGGDFFESGPERSIESINDWLDRGGNLEELLLVGNEYGYILRIKRLNDWTFVIDSGFLAGPLCGSGGMWLVEFDEFEQVVSAEDKGRWVS